MNNAFIEIPGVSRLNPSAQALVSAILQQPALYHAKKTIILPPLAHHITSSYFSGFQEAIDFLKTHAVPCSYFDLCQIELVSDGCITLLNLNAKNSYNMKQVVNAITKELLELTDGLLRETSQTSKFYRLYQRIATRYRYQDHPLGHSIYGLVSQKAGVCQAVSGMLCLCCSVLGIESSIVESRDHCWNLITLDGYTAHFDCTWDLGQTARTGFKFFGLSSEEIACVPDHLLATDNLPALEDSPLNWYRRKNLICTPASCVSQIRSQMDEYGIATCRIPGVLQSDIEQLITTALHGTAVRKYSYSVDALNTVTIRSVI